METKTLQQIKLSEIAESKTNPRKHFDELKLNELASSIEQHGVLQPIVVRISNNGTKYELVAGARRLRASKIAKKETIPVIALSLTDEQALEMQVIENLQRDDLHPLEEAEGYQALLKSKNYTAISIAGKVGKSPGYIRKRLQLLTLSEPVKKAWYDDKIMLSHAQLLSAIEDEKVQKVALQEVINQQASPSELAEYIRERLMVNLSSASFKLTDETLKPDMGACTTCRFNTNTDEDLFGEKQGQGLCRQPKCFQEKVQINFDRNKIEEEKKGNIVLSKSETKKIFPYAYSTSMTSNEWLDSEKACWEHPRDLSYKKLFDGKVKEYLILDADGKARRLYKKSEVDKVMKEQDWFKKKNEKSPAAKAQNDKWAREKKVNTIAEDLLRKQFLKKLESEGSVTLLCLLVIQQFGTGLVKKAKELNPELKAEKYDSEKTLPVFASHLVSMKTDKERINYAFSMILAEGETMSYSVENFFGQMLKIKKDGLKTQAKKIEAKQYADSKKAKKAK